MTPPTSFLDCLTLNFSRFQRARKPSEHPSQNKGAHLTRDDVLKELVAEALWRSFPEGRSETGIAQEAAPYFLKDDGQPVNERTIRFWLRKESLPGAWHFCTLVAMQPKIFLAHLFGGRK